MLHFLFFFIVLLHLFTHNFSYSNMIEKKQKAHRTGARLSFVLLLFCFISFHFVFMNCGWSSFVHILFINVPTLLVLMSISFWCVRVCACVCMHRVSASVCIINCVIVDNHNQRPQFDMCLFCTTMQTYLLQMGTITHSLTHTQRFHSSKLVPNLCPCSGMPHGLKCAHAKTKWKVVIFVLF